MSPLDEKTAESRLQEYKRVVTIGVTIAGAIIVGLSLWGRVRELAAALDTGSISIDAVLGLALFFVTLLVGAAWYISGNKELEILEDYKHYAPTRPALLLWVVIAAATTLALLLYFADRVFAYSVIYLPYSVVGVGTRLLARKEVGRLGRMADKDQSISTEYRQAVDRYYVRRPHGLLGVFVVGFALAGFVLAATGGSKVAAYAAILISILLSESVVWFWRGRLYAEIGRIEEKRLAAV